jgi:protein-tyrosine phosphatase
MIDIHCHVLPGMDDGPASMDKSIAMVRLAVADGIRGAICTPHWHPLFWPNERNAIVIAVETLRLRLQAEDIAFDVWPGSELSLDADLEAGIADGRLATLNGGSWVLLELPGAFLPSGIDNLLLNFLRSGRRLVLAHPERYHFILRDSARLHAWVEMGVAVQITAASLLGRLGPEIATLCRVLLEHRLVHFLASDGHGVENRRPLLREAYIAAAEIMGSDDAWRLVHTHPQAVVRNEPLLLVDFAPLSLPRKRPWFKFW